MLPPWMIEKLEQERREREAQDRPRVELEIEAPRDVQVPERRPTAPSGVVTIQVW